MCCRDADCAPGGNSCSDFACRCGSGVACSGDTLECCGEPGECTDTQNDPANCGTCGRVCEAYETCKSGTCACDVCGDSSCEFGSIQEAIDAVTAVGTTIHICPGRCQEALTIHQDLNLIGAGAGATGGDTVIDGAGTNSVVMIIQEGVTASLIGVHITGGQAGNGPGGIWHLGASLTMATCAVVGNSSTVTAGGVLIAAGTVTMANCRIQGNSTPVEGGGLLNDAGTVTLVTCDVVENGQNADGVTITQLGGGIFNGSNGTLNLQNGTFVSANHAVINANPEVNTGGGIYNLGRVNIDSTSQVVANSPDNCINALDGTGCLPDPG